VQVLLTNFGENGNQTVNANVLGPGLIVRASVNSTPADYRGEVTVQQGGSATVATVTAFLTARHAPVAGVVPAIPPVVQQQGGVPCGGVMPGVQANQGAALGLGGGPAAMYGAAQLPQQGAAHLVLNPRFLRSLYTILNGQPDLNQRGHMRTYIGAKPLVPPWSLNEKQATCDKWVGVDPSLTSTTSTCDTCSTWRWR
jgi:hypothetical protein